MVSPLYLQHLEGIFPVLFDEYHDSPTLDFLWQGFENAWNDMESVPDDEYLISMATHAFLISAKLQNKEPAALLAEAMALHHAKNKGYAGDDPDPWRNFRFANRFGVTTRQGVLVRLSDKYSRIKSLRENPANDLVGESLIDTVNDFGAYALIAVCVDREANASVPSNFTERLETTYDSAFD